jgi:anti-sigma factor RsiW
MAQNAANELTCQELVELITDYLEGALSPADRRRFDQHISKCDWCKIYIEHIKLTIKVAGKLSEASIDQRAKEELLAIFRHWNA